MTEEVIKEVITSTPVSAEPKIEDQLINSPAIIDGNSVQPDPKRKEKPVPHYLRPSTSSCHDNCKFGIRHSSESKKYWPVRRAQLRRASTGNQECNRAEIILPQRARRSKDQKLKICHVRDGNTAAPAKLEFTSPKAPLERAADHSDSTPCVEEFLSAEASEPFVAGNVPTDAKCFVISHDDVADCGDGEPSDGAVSIELEMPLAIQDSYASDENMEDAILPSEDVHEDGENSLLELVSDQSANDRASSEKRITQIAMASEKHEQAGLGTKSKSSANESVKPKAKATSSVTRNTVSTQNSRRKSHPKATGATVEISSGPNTMRKRADASGTTKFSREKKFSPTVSSAVPKVKEINVPSPSNATDSSAKPARLAKLKASGAKSAPSPSLSSGKMTDRKMTVKNFVKNAQVLQNKGEEKVITGPVKLFRSVNMPAKPISSVKLRVVRKEKIAPPIKNIRKVSGTENSAADAKDAKERVLKTASPKVRKPEVNNKESRPRKEKSAKPRTATARRPKPAPTIPSSNATQPPPRKLTFRRGKVLNPDDNSNTAPRRLQFRPAMAAADTTGRSRGGRVSTGRRVGSSAAGARDAGTSRAEVVVLRRRQDGGGEGKRQEQGLFNNVIEETASRLVAEARKSKVKALVGAFETVISLQEGSKAAAPATAAGVAP
ncbi:flocculation protein FLO11-like [Phragmites australis]|uniref:flocculation protein FLO11-like n=1 Tax=Phragmites australis TaxID=29695 RepID=UPI002D76B2F2|nr:flocculation protein FLO11-like [Phragmites australis]